MAKKQTKSSLTSKLDKIVSEMVRSRGRCEACGSTENLQCCHIFSRTYRSLRWSLDNLICGCAKCHFEWHKNPVKFVEFVKKLLGEEKYENLKENYRAITKHTLDDLQIKYNILREMKEINENHKTSVL